jgi:hypothetical protein
MQFGLHARLEENSTSNDLGVAGFLARYSKVQSKGIVPDRYLVKDVAGTSYAHSGFSNDSRFMDSKLAELNDLVSKMGDGTEDLGFSTEPLSLTDGKVVSRTA